MYSKPFKGGEVLRKFKVIRDYKSVSLVLREALGSNEDNCLFEFIAGEITEQEIRKYVDIQNDLFDLAKFKLTLGYDPLTGLFKTLEYNKLQVFLEATFQRSDFTEEFLERMVALIHKTDDPKKSNLFAWVSDDVFTKEKVTCSYN